MQDGTIRASDGAENIRFGGVSGAIAQGIAEPDLTEAEAELVRAALAGEEADLKRRPIRAVILRALLLEARAGWTLPAVGLRLHQAIIQGTLDLDGCTLSKPIQVRHSRFEGSVEDGAILLRDARLKRLGIHASTIEGDVRADRADVENGLFLGGGVIRGAVLVRGAIIGGALSLEGSEIGAGEVGVDGTGLRVKGPLILRRARVSGSVLVPRAHLEGGIYADGVRIAAETLALDAESARIAGDAQFTDAELKGTLCVHNVRLEGRFTADSLVIDSLPVAFDARGFDASHGLVLDNARLRGMLRLEGAGIGKAFRAEAIEVDGGETAIAADLIRIDGNWEMPRARLIGQLKLPGARVEGQLRLTEARLFGHDVALRADGARLRGGCFMSRATMLGLVRFPACEIGNQFRLRGATLKVEAGAALLASGAAFGRDVELTNGFQSSGAIVLDQARIAGVLDLSGSRLGSACLARGPLPMPGAAGRLDEIALSLIDATVTRLVMPATAAERPRGIVDLSRLHAGSFEDFADAWPPQGPQRARCKDGRDIDHLVLDGFRYDHLANPSGAAAFAANLPAGRSSAMRVSTRRMAWLEAQTAGDLGTNFKPQAWVGLAERLERQGFGDDAQRIDVGRRRRERSSSGVTASVRWQSRLLDWLALYGHNPWRTVVWMAAVVVVFAGIWGAAARLCTEPGCFDESVFVVRNKDAYREESFKRVYPGFHALAYSFDVFVPFISFGYEDHWRPNLEYRPLAEVPLPFSYDGTGVTGAVGKGPAIAITLGGILYVLGIVEALLGLLLTSLMVTGFTGLLRNRGS